MLRSSIEYGTINETALVDNLHLIGSLRHLALTSLDYLILQSARQYLYTWLLGILGKELLASARQDLSLELACLLLCEEGSIVGKSSHETTAEHRCIDRILGTLQFLTGSRQDALVHHLRNLHTHDVGSALRSISLGDSLLVTTDEICHVSSIYLITLLDEWNQATCGMNTSCITQRIALCGKNHRSYLLYILFLLCCTNSKQRSTRHEDECCH